MLKDSIRWVHDLEGRNTVAHTFVKTEKSRASWGQPVKPCWLNKDLRGCFAEQSGFVDLGSLTKMKCVRTTIIPPTAIIWWVLWRVDRRKAPWSMKF